MSAITATILSEGNKTDAGFKASHIDIYKEVNRIPTAQITLPDGDIAKRLFKLSDSSTFEHGNEIEIKLRYEKQGSDVSVFKGIVVNQNVEANGGHAHLVVEMRDVSFKMCSTRQSIVYENKKDSDIILDLITAQGLTAGTIEDTKDVHSEIVQYDCTDWDFMLMRAEANGLLVIVEAGTISLVNPEKASGNEHSLEFGMNKDENPIYALEMSSDMTQQAGSFKTTAWDIEKQEMTSPNEGSSPSPKQGNLDAEALAEKAGAKEVLLSTPSWRPANELATWANSRAIRNRLSLFRGWIATQGKSTYTLLDTLTIAGISNKFNGKNLITGVRHQYSPGMWRTEIQIGLSDEPFVRTFPNAESLPANGLLPAIQGLHIGVVESFEKDPDGQFRVRVRIPTLKEGGQTIWARQIRPDAGKERGIVFYPEPNDEVVLGFLNGDPREAIIIGSLHSSAKALPKDIATLKEDNDFKGIFTKNGLKILFDDKKKSVSIQTPAGKKITLDDNSDSLRIEDKFENQIIMDKDGITMKTKKNFKIEAKNVDIKDS